MVPDVVGIVSRPLRPPGSLSVKLQALVYDIIIIIIDRFYIALFSALEQTHCARM